MKASSISVIPCALQSFFARQIRALFMADLLRLVKMAIWIGGIEIFIGGEQMDSTFALSKKRIIMKKFYLCLFKNRMKQ